jgi:hypothetical protein
MARVTDQTYYWQAARRMWQQQLEAAHALVYYAPEVFEEFSALGYDVSTRWPTYFPLRAAPLGEAGPKQVAAAFYSFSPRMVAEHVSCAWGVASREKVLAARLPAGHGPTVPGAHARPDRERRVR